ncbi:hypothetical protein OWM54_40285 [Myxococcus sp. MISCRS1]|uniref:hypothetical protein n=1 Tax=unclassified Myxococcus TaxID=2648731 RepID=UPI001CBCCD4D|nr:MULTISPECIES: hypothetical protein [unclassified Myxococcus]MBZ4398075.1 hypothetical protein [Myxococcus sp. AS-1-15]MCY1003405.1 hypothetical protein [Myxococcus sp. MISCRS1]
MKPNEVVSVLRGYGVRADFNEEGGRRIVGGRRLEGMKVIDPFIIYEKGGKWLFGVPGASGLGEDHEMASLDEAVERVRGYLKLG